MHAFDRTLLARLGFADPDKGDRKHDLACQYIAQPLVASKLVTVSHAHRLSAGTLRDIEVKKVRHEVPVSKGEGQYKTTIGFLDALIAYECEKFSQWEEGGAKKDGWWKCSDYLVAEVKVKPVDAGTILRQINLYREYINSAEVRYIVVAAYTLGAADVEMLHNAAVAAVTLGKDFEAYCASRLAGGTNPAAVPEI